MQTVFIVAASVAALIYILTPLLLWFTGSRIPAIQWEVLDPGATIPHAPEAHFWKTTTFLSSNGFDRAGARVRESMANGMANYAQLWRNSETGEAAFVATTLKDDGALFCRSYVIFLHERENGGLIATSNLELPARVNLDPMGASKLNAPKEDTSTLRALHRGHALLLGERLRPIRMRDALTLCQALDASVRTTALAKKRYRASGDALRVTLWGAFYGVWINLPPLKSLYARRDRRWLYMAREADDSRHAQEHRAA